LAPTPYSPNGRLNLRLVVSSLVHEIEFPVEIQEIASVWQAVSARGGAVNIDAGDLAQMIWTLFRPVYNTGVSAPTWTLFERDVNIFVPVASGSTTGAGTESTASGLGYQSTLTFRDSGNVLYRLQLPETAGSNLFHSQYSALSSVEQDVVDGWTLDGSGANPGDYVQSRAQAPITRFLFWTRSTNRKYRRARGLA